MKVIPNPSNLRTFCPRAVLLAVALISLLLPFALVRPARAETQQQEESIGQKEAAEVDKSVKFDTDPTDVQRVTSIGAKIADVADSTQVPAGFGNDTLYKFKYTYKIIDDKTINAFSIPGGHIYIYSGLLHLLKTDDELAGVLAHETAHAAHHHVVTLSHEANKLNNEYLLGVLAAILAHDSNVGADAYVGSLAAQAQLNNHFSTQAEKDADHTGMIYMQKAGFNPIGMLSMLQRLQDQENLSPDIELGYLRDHPLTPERVAAAKDELKALGVAVDPKSFRLASGAITAKVLPDKTGQQQTVSLFLGDNVVCSLPSSGQTAEQTAAVALNQLLDQNLQMYEVKSDGNTLIARGQVILTFSAPTTLPSGANGQALAKSAADAIRNALWSQQVNGDNIDTPAPPPATSSDMRPVR
jgi:predicted Zn-dependent protease